MFYFVFLTCVGHILGAHLYRCGNKGFGFGQSSFVTLNTLISLPSKYLHNLVKCAKFEGGRITNVETIS